MTSSDETTATPSNADTGRATAERHGRAPDLGPFRSELIARFPAKDELLRQAVESRRKTRAKRVTAVLLVCAAAAGTVYLNPVYRSETLTTQATAPRTWQLADGTRLSLDADSEITVQWRIRSRELALTRGAAAFDVGQSPRPFTVTAHDVTIHDIGTLFGVRTGDTRDSATRVSVEHGEVRVASGDQSATLQRNQGVVILNGNVGPVSTVDGASEIAWKDGRLQFDGTPLSVAVAQIQRYYAQRIVLKDPGVAQLRLSGQYDIADVESLLRALPSILPVSVSRQNDGAYVIASRR